MQLILALVLAVLVGLTLGLAGSGGSILTVPILVYVLDILPVKATGYSLFIVGLSALTGSFGQIKNKDFDLNIILRFGGSSVLSVLLTRIYVLPSLPEVIFANSIYTLTLSNTLMLMFSILMLLAAWSMIKPNQNMQTQDKNHSNKAITVSIYGVMIGLVTGLLGAGGGFLIVPVLVNKLKMDLKNSIGTSLLLISVNALIGFAGYMYKADSIDWKLLLLFSLFSITGILAGKKISVKIPASVLKPALGWFILVMGAFILLGELLK